MRPLFRFYNYAGVVVSLFKKTTYTTPLIPFVLVYPLPSSIHRAATAPDSLRCTLLAFRECDKMLLRLPLPCVCSRITRTLIVPTAFFFAFAGSTCMYMHPSITSVFHPVARTSNPPPRPWPCVPPRAISCRSFCGSCHVMPRARMVFCDLRTPVILHSHNNSDAASGGHEHVAHRAGARP